MAWPDIRPVLGTDDIEHNFEVVMEQIELLSGSNPIQVAPYVPATGGTFTGGIDAPAVTVGGQPVALQSLTYSVTAADATFRTIADSYAKSETYTQSEVDALVPGTATVLTEGVVLQSAAVAALSLTVSASFVQAEVQSIATKVDAILTALKNAGIMAT